MPTSSISGIGTYSGLDTALHPLSQLTLRSVADRKLDHSIRVEHRSKSTR